MLPAPVGVEVEGCELEPLGPVGPEAGLQDPAEVGVEVDPTGVQWVGGTVGLAVRN